MTWLQRYRIRHYVTNAIWIWPLVSAVAAVATAHMLYWLDASLDQDWGFDPDTVRAVLGTMASSLFTFIVFVSSALLVAVQLASAQLTPRIIATVFRDPAVKVSLTVFVFTFTFMLAALLMWSLVVNWGLSPFLGAVVVLAGSIPFSLLLEKFLVRPFYNVPNRNIVYFIMTLGLAQIFAGAFTGTYGRWSDQFSLPAAWPGAIMLGPFPFPRTRLLVLVIALTLLAGLFVFLRLHRVGRALRAVFQNREAAILRGVDVRRIYRFSFVLAMLVITMGGVLFAMAYGFDLTMAWTMAIIGFAIMIVGGPGSVLGSVVIGMIFGAGEQVPEGVAAERQFFAPGTLVEPVLVAALVYGFFDYRMKGRAPHWQAVCPPCKRKSLAVAKMMKDGLLNLHRRGSRLLWRLQIWRCVRA